MKIVKSCYDFLTKSYSCVSRNGPRFSEEVCQSSVCGEVEKNPKIVSREVLVKALKLDDMILLSCCYDMGIGTTVSLTKAIDWCVRAARMGAVSALLTSIALLDSCEASNRAVLTRLN